MAASSKVFTRRGIVALVLAALGFGLLSPQVLAASCEDVPAVTRALLSGLGALWLVSAIVWGAHGFRGFRAVRSWDRAAALVVGTVGYGVLSSWECVLAGVPAALVLLLSVLVAVMAFTYAFKGYRGLRERTVFSRGKEPPRGDG